MKRILSFMLMLCLLTALICGCSTPVDENTSTSQSTTDTTSDTSSSTETTDTQTDTEISSKTTETTETEESSTVVLACEHEYTETVTKEAGNGIEGEKRFDCSKCGDSYTEVITSEKTVTSIKILAIGNSFSVDAMQYLWDICYEAGIEEIILGNLYIGGCSLDTHWANMSGDKSAYEFQLCEFGTWTKSTKSVRYALEYTDWDVITVQQVSQDSGRPETMNNLQNILDYIGRYKKNEDAKIYWHMTWAYQQNTGHSGFQNYNKDQNTMYNAIVSVATDFIPKYDEIDGVIPSGTTVQNLRTSYLGDTLTRDGYHMSYDIGRYAAALTWFETLTGLSAGIVDWVPTEYPSVAEDITVIREAVANARENPFAVTDSVYLERTNKYCEMTDENKAELESLGYAPEDYLMLDLQMTVNAFWNSGNNSILQTKDTSNATNLAYFNASVRFDRNQLPLGSIIVVDEGYQYRPEAWYSLANKTNPRPENTTEAVTVVDETWWGGYTFRAFNLSSLTAETAMTALDIEKLRIYIPVNPPEPEVDDGTVKYEALTESDIAILTAANLNPEDYEVLVLKMTVASYWNSLNGSVLTSGANSNASNIPNFISTQILEKSAIPNGSVISIANGYQYRPEGWIDLDTKNSKRPDNVLTSIVIVDDAWWGDYNYRAFNIATIGAATAMTTNETSALRIYVPKS